MDPAFILCPINKWRDSVLLENKQGQIQSEPCVLVPDWRALLQTFERLSLLLCGTRHDN